MINWTQQKYLRSVCLNSCEYKSWIWGGMKVDIISRRICCSSRSLFSLEDDFLSNGVKKKKRDILGTKVDFLESLRWNVTRRAKKSSQKINGRGTVLDFSKHNDGWGGHCAPREQKGGRGNDGAACVCVWESMSPCASVNESLCVTLKRQGEIGKERCWVSCLNLCCCPRHSLNVGGEGTEKISFSICAQWSPCLLTSSYLPFHPVPSPLSFSLSCLTKLFGTVPSCPEAVSSLLAKFLKMLSASPSVLLFSSVLVL